MAVAVGCLRIRFVSLTNASRILHAVMALLRRIIILSAITFSFQVSLFTLKFKHRSLQFSWHHTPPTSILQKHFFLLFPSLFSAVVFTSLMYLTSYIVTIVILNNKQFYIKILLLSISCTFYLIKNFVIRFKNSNPNTHVPVACLIAYFFTLITIILSIIVLQFVFYQCSITILC